MANLSAVVQQLKKERANAQRVVGRLDAVLKGASASWLWELLLPPAAKDVRCRPEKNCCRSKSEMGESKETESRLK